MTRVIDSDSPVILPELEIRLSPNRSKRTFGPVHLVVVHCPQGWWAGTDATVMDKDAEVSYHILLRKDGGLARQYVPWDKKAWSCKAYNSFSDNIALEGFVGKPYEDYALKVLARIVAFRLHTRNLPATFIAGPKLEQGKGWTYHSELGIIGGNHSDPGFTRSEHKRFLGYVSYELRRGGFRKVWGVGDHAR